MSKNGVVVVLLMSALVVGACGGGSDSGGGESAPVESASPSAAGELTFNGDSSTIPVIIKNWGIALAPFDAASGKAGVMEITGVVPPQFPNPADTALYKLIASSYGGRDPGVQDPQMLFVAPLGTEVISMIDGTVCDLPKLYSDDYSVRVAPAGMSCYPAPYFGADILYEHEHVIDPLVKVGDTVTAGQHIATVSTWLTAWKEKGFGAVEIGVFYSKAPNPWHACLANYIDPSVKAQMLDALLSIQQAWTAERGDTTLYPPEEAVGCVTTADIQD